jgi:hypothetical protein
MMLGSGIVTLIPYSSYLLLFGVETVSGPWIAAAMGACFGFMREAIILVILLRSSKREDAMEYLPDLAKASRYLNMFLSFAGGLALFTVALL